MKNVIKLARTIVKAEVMSNTAQGESLDPEERKKFKKEFSKLWIEIMKWENMTPTIVRQIVSILPDHIMEHLEKPIHMSDFLLESFKISKTYYTIIIINKYSFIYNFV